MVTLPISESLNVFESPIDLESSMASISSAAKSSVLLFLITLVVLGEIDAEFEERVDSPFVNLSDHETENPLLWYRFSTEHD